MRKRTLVFVGATCISFYFFYLKPDYYDNDCLSQSGLQLRACLHERIAGHKVFPYSSKKRTDVWGILKESDQDPDNSKNVILVYSGITTNASQQYNSGQGWVREHVWSASHGGFQRTDVMGTDVHHIKPSHSFFNGPKGKWARDFDDGGSPIFFLDRFFQCSKTNSTFEPRDEVKGDVARMLFYMDVRYDGDDGLPDLELKDYVPTLFQENSPHYGKLSTLLRWHKDDPVDDFEINRNEIIFQYQGNRNPFVDHPELVEKIWGPDLENEYLRTIKEYFNQIKRKH